MTAKRAGAAVIAAALLAVLSAPVLADRYDEIVADLESGESARILTAMLEVRLLTATDFEGIRTRTRGHIRKCLASKSHLVRAQAAYLLGTFRAKEAWEDLVKSLEDSSSHVRSWSLAALWEIAERDETKVIAPLTRAFADPSWDVLLEASDVCIEMEVLPEPLVPVLARALEKRDRKLRKEEPEVLAKYRKRIVLALSKAKEKAAPATPALVSALEYPGVDVRVAVARAIGTVGPGARAAEPALAKALVDDSIAVRRAAAAALSRTGASDRKTARALARHVDGEDGDLRRMAAAALEAMGANGEPGVHPLHRALKEDDARLRAAAARALGAIGPEASSAARTLEKLAEKDPDAEVREAARSALASIAAGGEGKED